MTSRPNHPSSANSRHRPIRSAVGLAMASVTVALLTTGCSMQDAQCGGGEYPVLAVGSTGGACRYPEGKVPEHVGDKWDTYWSTRTVDKNGEIIELPQESS
jgi:hypothetical protein